MTVPERQLCDALRKLLFVFKHIKLSDDDSRLTEAAWNCAHYFGGMPSEDAIVFWIENMSHITDNHQSVGIVAWDGDE